MRSDQPARSDRLPEGGFNVVTPEFDVGDLDASLRFWCGALGFTIAYARAESGFAYLERDGCQVMLSAINGNWQTGPLEKPLGRGINVQIDVATIAPLLSGLEAVFLAAVSRAARGLVSCRARGGRRVRQFLVQDPEGYLLRFAEPLGRR